MQVLAYKSPFAQKYLTRYTHETFFEEYMNFETHYLSHYRVIPLQIFVSHIRPQPHRLGLILFQLSYALQLSLHIFFPLFYCPWIRYGSCFLVCDQSEYLQGLSLLTR
jgi:hypothetical protein